MLQILRSSSGGLVAKAFMILLIISFGAWGVQGYLDQAGQGEIVATVGDETITTSELAAAFALDVRRFQAQGSDLTAQQARNLGLMDLALDRLIQGRTYDAASVWLGMGISDKNIAQAIREEELFRDDSGNFSRSRFEFLLRNSGVSEAQYVLDLRRDMIKREIINSLAFTAGAPAVLEKRLHLYRNEKRVATMTVVPVDDALDVGVPDDASIAQIHQDQAERYTAPERMSATFVILTAERAMKDVTVTEEGLRDRYEDNLASYTTPEKRTVQQIPFADEESARKAAGMIGEGRTFETVAKETAGIEGEALTYGEFTAGDFPIPDLAPTIQALGEGAISEPVSTDFGWHIFRVAAIQPVRVSPFEEVREQIENRLKTELASELLYNMSTTLEDELAGGATLEGAAAALGVETRKTGLVDIEGMDSDGKPVDGLPGGEFLNTLFFTVVGEQSALGQTPEGSYYILRVDEIVPSELRPLAEVRDEIVAGWQTEQRRKTAQTRALAIVERIENGEPLSGIAAAEGLETSDSNPFTRRSEGVESNLLTPVLVGDMFQLQPGQASMAETGDGFVIAELKSIQPAGPSDTGNMASVIGSQITGDILRQFDAALREEFEVDIDQAAVARTLLPQ
jgi:peptidyl-prolyl cis-trans isomerase D